MNRNIVTIVLIIIALVVSIFAINKIVSSKNKQNLVLRTVPEWENIQFMGEEIGNENPYIQIVEFFDYECPYCKEVNPILGDLLDKYPEKISITFVHFPLVEHENAYRAAIAVECARNQGKFYEFHNQLFENQDKLYSFDYDSLAAIVGVTNIDKFSHCLNNSETERIIKSGINLANRLEIGGVPTFMINGKIVPGALSISEFEEVFRN